MSKLSTTTGLRSYYLAATSARIGDEMVGVAIVLLVLDRTGSAPLAGAIVAAYTLPTVLSGPILGAWLDRTRCRRALLAANQVMLAAVMSAMLWVVGTTPNWVPIALAPLVGLTVPMTSGGFTSLLPRIVPDRLLGRAHAFEGATFNASAILGPAGAATVAAAVSADAAVAAIAGFAVLSLCALTGIPASVNRAPTAPTAAVLGSLRAGLTHLLHTRPLRGATVATSTAFVGVGMLTVALPTHVESMTGEAALSGYVWAAIEIGAVVAALAWAKWHARWLPQRAVLACCVGFGLVMLTWPAVDSFAALLALAALAGTADGAGLPALFTTRQKYTPSHMYSQISTTGASLKLGAFALGAALGGQLAVNWDAAVVLGMAAAMQLLGAALGAVCGGLTSGPAHRAESPQDAEPAAPLHKT